MDCKHKHLEIVKVSPPPLQASPNFTVVQCKDCGNIFPATQETSIASDVNGIKRELETLRSILQDMVKRGKL